MCVERNADNTTTAVACGEFKVGLNSTLVVEETQEIHWIHGLPRDEPICGFKNDSCLDDTVKIKREEYNKMLEYVKKKDNNGNNHITLLLIISGVILLVAGTVTSAFMYRHFRYEQRLSKLLWKIEFKDINFAFTSNELNPHSRNPLSSLVMNSATSLLSADTRTEYPVTVKADYRGNTIAVKHLPKRNLDMNRAMKEELLILKEVSDDNLNRFLGACIEPGNICIVTQYCSRGSIKDTLQSSMKFSEMLIASFVNDILKGMIRLHDSRIEFHGNLRSSNCLVDSRWVVKLTDFGLTNFAGQFGPNSCSKEEYDNKLLWKAPEQLRNTPLPASHKQQRCDVYSFGLLLFDIIGRQGPWGNIGYTEEEIVEQVRDHYIRPDLNELDCQIVRSREHCLKKCIQDCWQEESSLRPTFSQVILSLRELLSKIPANIMDNVVTIMGDYADDLEEVVARKTVDLDKEKKKTDALLNRMLPKIVAEQLKMNKSVIPVQFQCCTIYFSDVVGFTTISSESTPMQVVDLLNDLYLLFDKIIDEYDVYKVETIGDAYMVASGLPICNDNRHAGEIASMSLHLLKEMRSFKIRHKPDEFIQLRIGIHSGPVVAGVVGSKMPRYCLFGDTVNVASRMESTGLPLKIHCSESCTRILNDIGGYILEERGLIKVKGKGDIFTYFLSGEDKRVRRKRLMSACSPETTPNSETPTMCLSTVDDGESLSSLSESRKCRLRGVHYDSPPIDLRKVQRNLPMVDQYSLQDCQMSPETSFTSLFIQEDGIDIRDALPDCSSGQAPLLSFGNCTSAL